MTSTPIYIHEFSTGIEAERTADGGWVSQQFTGKYINRTIDPIPRAVQEAITNREFAVAEGSSSEEPTVIGREVISYGEEWSVVVVVTVGKDNKGRSASVCRYFLCEGRGHLGTILAWMNAQRQAGQSYVFDPFDAQTVGHPHKYEGVEPDVALDKLKHLLDASSPIIIPSDLPCAPLLINKMASKVAGDRPIAWGYKVEALEEPRGFQIIQPASRRAEELLRKAIASKPNTPAPIAGEKTLISAINGLIKRDRIKPEHLETIENALANPQVDAGYWETIFKGRGADKALKQGIYTADMVRLLTLRAMAIPKTLPEFLAWMDKGGKQKGIFEISESFQAEIKRAIGKTGPLPELQFKIYEGVKLIIPRLIKQPELLEATTWLLKSPNGTWRSLYEHRFKNELDSDLGSMSRYVCLKKEDVSFNLKDDKGWTAIFDELQVYWKHYLSPMQPKYQPFAQLFALLGDYKLSAFFYHICSGVVPKKVFSEITSQDFRCSAYGIKVQRETDKLEVLLLTTKQIGEQIMPVHIVVPLLICTLALGAFGGRLTASRTENTPREEFETAKIDQPQPETQEVDQASREFNTPVETNEQQSSNKPEEEKLTLAKLINEKQLSGLDQNTQANAVNNFEGRTQDALQDIIEKLKSQSGEPEIKKEIIVVLFDLQRENHRDLQLIDSINNNVFDLSLNKSEEKEAWTKAIYNYQERQQTLTADGIIDSRGKTAKKLKNEVEQNLGDVATK